jgi:hypothetical protein
MQVRRAAAKCHHITIRADHWTIRRAISAPCTCRVNAYEVGRPRRQISRKYVGSRVRVEWMQVGRAAPKHNHAAIRANRRTIGGTIPAPCARRVNAHQNHFASISVEPIDILHTLRSAKARQRFGVYKRHIAPIGTQDTRRAASRRIRRKCRFRQKIDRQQPPVFQRLQPQPATKRELAVSWLHSAPAMQMEESPEPVMASPA